jgi:hypothetical protein
MVYSALGSGVLVSCVSGYLSGIGLIPPVLLIALFIFSIISEIVSYFMDRNNKIAQRYLKPGSFYSLSVVFGGIIGLMFLTAGKEDKLLLAQITASAFIYSISIFICFSVFALLTVRRTVKYIFLHKKIIFNLGYFLWGYDLVPYPKHYQHFYL